MTIGKTQIRFLVALPCEAKPLIAHFRLARLAQEDVFAIYRNDAMSLTQTGVGKIAMAAGVAYTQARLGALQPTAWLNAGVAGHPECALGDAFLAHRISDAESRRNWYPPIIATPPCRTERLITVAKAESRYETQALYDQEASAFYEIACRFSSAERVQCFKVVSDNRASPADQLNARRVSELIEARITMIEALVDQQQRLPIIEHNSFPEVVEAFARCWHFTVQQRMQIESLVNRFMLLDPEQCPKPDEWVHFKNASGVIAGLERKARALSAIFT